MLQDTCVCPRFLPLPSRFAEPPLARQSRERPLQPKREAAACRKQGGTVEYDDSISPLILHQGWDFFLAPKIGGIFYVRRKHLHL